MRKTSPAILIGGRRLTVRSSRTKRHLFADSLAVLTRRFLESNEVFHK